jgi:hypothetical protein
MGMVEARVRDGNAVQASGTTVIPAQAGIQRLEVTGFPPARERQRSTERHQLSAAFYRAAFYRASFL